MALAQIENQSELARRLGIERQAISRWKSPSGTKDISREHYFNLSLWSGLTPSYIEFGTRPKYLPQNDFQDRLLAAAQLLPEADQERLAAQAEFEAQRWAEKARN
jgi:transcriptional regulator with XRE-family HTH domain